MAMSRDGGNLFEENRLEEIRERMDAIENLTVTYNDNVFTWEDVCTLNGLGAGTSTTYKFPCARLSPMDFFQETRTYFKEVDRVTWYHGVVRGAAIRPRVLRFGILQQHCLGLEEGQSDACKVQAGLRLNPDFAEQMGYPREYANPLGLIGDVGSLELSDNCRICIEESLEAKMEKLQHELVVPFFSVLARELRRFQQTLADPEELAQVDDLATKAEKIAKKVDKRAVEDFYYYQVLRSTYAELGAEAYQSAYNQLITPDAVPLDCSTSACPKFNITLEDSKQALRNHADNTFSSITTAGSPLPAWSESDGSGIMLQGFNPVGGSGVNMSADTLSAVAYLDLVNYRNTSAWNPLYANSYADPLNDPNWVPLVETNPVYAWFMAGETEMTAHCGNGNLTGSETGDRTFDTFTNFVAVHKLTQYWCTKYAEPFEEDATRTKQHFARMFYDGLLDSDSFLGITQGSDDPYTWTLGAGCGYSLGGERYSYTEQSEADVLANASGNLYFIEEGVSVGVVDRNLLIGDATPPVGNYNFSNPLQKVGVVQSLFALLGEPKAIRNRVSNCNRPGGPLNITDEDAEEVLYLAKERFDEIWSKGWDDESAGEVQFVGFVDDVGVVGTTGRFLKEITLSNGWLTTISILIICCFSVFLMFSLDAVESKVALTLVGCGLVVLSYFAALGFSIMIGIKINVATAWTLPFILLGLGVDDMYIVLLALKKESQKGHSEDSFLRGMQEVVVPVTMTSLVNASMFAIMNISDVPAVNLTARVALIAVVFLYLSIIFCFSAYCFLDMKRQAAGTRDVFCCTKAGERSNEDSGNKCVGTWLSTLLYDKLFKPLVLGNSTIRIVSHLLIWAVAAGLVGVSIYGITEREVGLGLEDFFPHDHQAQQWASKRTESLGSWSIGMNWGALTYTEPETQMKMIKQFEDVIAHPNVADVDTKQLWIADLAIWTSRMCDANVARSNPSIKMCGRDQVWPVDNSTCAGTWKRNAFGLRQKIFNDMKGQCNAYEGGICRPTSKMHFADLIDLGINMSAQDQNEVWCPVMEGWSDDKLRFCIKQWRFLAGGGGGLILEDEHGSPTQCQGEYYSNEEIKTPIPYSTGPTMFSFNLLSHEITTTVIEETRAICDDDKELHCWLTGIPYNYWSQYIGIFSVLVEISAWSVCVGFVVAVLFLLAQHTRQGGNRSLAQNVGGSLAGALLITAVMILSLVSVIGLSILAGVSITGFSIMSFVLSVGFSVEYAVHVVSRWLHAPNSIQSASDRVDYAMAFLTLPTFMSFMSSCIGVATLSQTEFSFTQVFYFRPLIIVMPVTYYFGCWWLPAFLSILDFEFVKLGGESEEVRPQEQPIAEKQGLPEPTDIHRLSDQEDSDNGKAPSLLEDITSEVEC
ncbi:Protein patched homolog 1 [Seminavis robusta]|uniref:Protein patched homolog 1 n=1 Tax=Seminavis robusta TaxID=568900 RepID=A0A9N8HN68_9STRA|nr:Protein patched homolog 1 [Seminavis robusta]|eukprot:Sro965_g225630.1 Protein patched homolog 1 (1380) ;mRNA; r:30010-34629